MTIKVDYNAYIHFFEAFTKVFIIREFQNSVLPKRMHIYTYRLWIHTPEIKQRALEIIGTGISDPQYFRKFISRFKHNAAPGIDRLALLGALEYFFQYEDPKFLQNVPKKYVSGRKAQHLWDEFCNRNEVAK